jgi:hypothetical protein
VIKNMVSMVSPSCMVSIEAWSVLSNGKGLGTRPSTGLVTDVLLPLYAASQVRNVFLIRVTDCRDYITLRIVVTDL